MRRIVGILLLTLVAAAPALAQDASPKEARVRELLILLRAGDMGVQVIDNMMEAMKGAMPEAPDTFFSSFRSRVKASDLVDLLVPIYAKHLEAEDVEELIRFYSSPTGKRFLERQPLILQESMTVGQKWGEGIAKQALEELQKRED